MKYKHFKKLKLSTLGMGNMRLPVTGDKNIDEARAQEMIDFAMESGVNYYDTAYRYHGGQSELFIGKALAKYPRDSWYLASKMPGHMMEYVDGKLAFKGYLSGSTIENISEIFEDQLKRCQVDYFDFYLLHNVCETSFDFYTNEEVGVVKYLMEQKAAGRIRHLGFSSHGSAATIEKFLDKYDCFEFCQIQLNYMDWTLQDACAKYELLTERGIPVVVMEPVRGGKLTNLPAKARAIMENAAPGMTEAAWALKYLQRLPNVQVVLSGMSSMEQLTENIALFSDPKPLDDAQLKALDDVLETLLDSVPCTACRYCCDVCPAGLDIPNLIGMYNQAKIDGMGTLKFNMGKMKPEELPSACLECGACASVCPQNIEIPKVLKDFDELMKK